MLSKKTASKIGYNLGGGIQSATPFRRTSRGSLEIFGGGRPHSQTAALLQSRQQPRQDALRGVLEEAKSEDRPTEPTENETREFFIPVPVSDKVAANHSGQINRWLADVAAEAFPRSQSYPAPPSTELGSEKRASETISLVDDDLVELLRISESQDWEVLKIGELLGGDLKSMGEEAVVEDARFDNSQSRKTAVPLPETPPEWEGVLEGKVPSKGQTVVGSGRPPSGQGRQRRKSGLSTTSESPPEWEDGKGGSGHGIEGNSRRTSEVSDVPPEWERLLQGKASSVNDGIPPTGKSRTSSTSETSPEWEKVLREGGGLAPTVSRSRHSRQSDASATSAMSEDSERGARWKSKGGDDRLSQSSCLSEESVISERAAQWGYEVKLKTTNGEERLSGSSWISATSISDGSKSSWTTSEASAGTSSGSFVAHAIPGVSKSISDALASFQLAFVVCDATDPDHPILYASAGFFAMTGYSAKEVVGKNCRFLQGEYTDASDRGKIREALGEGKIYTGKILNYRKDASPFWNLLTISPIKDDQGKLIKWIGMLAEVKENDSSQEQKMRAEAETRIRDEVKKQKEMSLNPSSISETQVPVNVPPTPPKKVEASTQTSFTIETRTSRGNESQRRASYTLTNHSSSRYSAASLRLSSDCSVDLPDWRAPGRVQGGAQAAKQEVVESNTSRTSAMFEIPHTPPKSSKSRFGRLFNKLKNISVSATSSKRNSAEIEAPFEFSSSDEDHVEDTTNPREAAELARLQVRSATPTRSSTEERLNNRHRSRRSSSTSYNTASEGYGRRSSLDEDLRTGGRNSSASSNGTRAPGNKDMGQFCVVHS